jgi:hypothetical protein
MKIFRKIGSTLLVLEDIGFSAKNTRFGNEILVEVLSEDGVIDVLVLTLQKDESIEDLLLHTAQCYELVAA